MRKAGVQIKSNNGRFRVEQAVDIRVTALWSHLTGELEGQEKLLHLQLPCTNSSTSATSVHPEYRRSARSTTRQGPHPHPQAKAQHQYQHDRANERRRQQRRREWMVHRVEAKRLQLICTSETKYVIIRRRECMGEESHRRDHDIKGQL